MGSTIRISAALTMGDPLVVQPGDKNDFAISTPPMYPFAPLRFTQIKGATMSRPDEYFGSTDQQALMSRSDALWRLMREDTRVSYYGRTVALTLYEPGMADLLTAMAGLLGSASFIYVHANHTDELTDHIAALGFKSDRFESLISGPETLTSSRAVLQANALPEDLKVIAIDEATDPGVLIDLDVLTQDCGVLLLKGAILRGAEKPSVCLAAFDAEGRAVAVAAAVAINHPDGPRGQDAWWGMLATREDRRGQRISLILGAMTMVEMNRRHGFENFMTGVRKGNTASERLCAKLGVMPSDYSVVVAIDPTQFAGDRITK